MSPEFRRQRCTAAALLLFVLIFCGPCLPALAQQSADPETGDSSQQVEESEESYRRRMELREQRYNERPQVQTTYATHTGDSKLDQLPPESREHIKEQLRDMIIENRQWQPGDEITDYPYEPSVAAQSDPALLQAEREAWVEQLEKFQEREAAAYANGGSGQAGQDQAQQGQSGQQQQGQGAAGSNSRQSSNNAKAGSASQSADAASYADSRDASSQEVSARGVSESALSFLQGKSGMVGQENGPGDADTAMNSEDGAAGANPAGAEADGQGGEEKEAEAAGAAAIPGTLKTSELAMLQGIDRDAAAASDGKAMQQATASSVQQSAGSGTSTPENGAEAAGEEDLAGTVAIEELSNIQASLQPAGGQATVEVEIISEAPDGE